MTPTPVERPAPAPDLLAVADRVAAARDLLMHPLIPADGRHVEELRRVRRHQVELTKVFSEGVGYRLVIDPSGARLFKPGLGRDPGRSLLRRSGASFTPRAYALLCLVVAVLTRARSQLLVDELVTQVRSAAVDAGMEVDLDAMVDRRALHAALVALIELGVLHERDGDLEHWAERRTPSLLDVRQGLLSLLLGPSVASASGPADLLGDTSLPSAAGGARRAIRRRLLESPILTTADLPEDHAEWWSRNRNREAEWFREHWGLVLELRAEGAIAVDPAGELSDIEFPGRGGTRQLALLCLEALVDEARAPGPPSQAWTAIAGERALATCHDVLQQWSEVLRRDQREAPERAVDDALDVLQAMGLVRRTPPAGQVWVHAAAARYAPAPAIAERADTGEQSLFAVPEEEVDD